MIVYIHFRKITRWYRDFWWQKSNIVATDFFLSNNLVDVSRNVNRRRSICRGENNKWYRIRICIEYLKFTYALILRRLFLCYRIWLTKTTAHLMMLPLVYENGFLTSLWPTAAVHWIWETLNIVFIPVFTRESDQGEQPLEADVLLVRGGLRGHGLLAQLAAAGQRYATRGAVEVTLAPVLSQIVKFYRIPNIQYPQLEFGQGSPIS